jgi:uncharacterized protein (TIGR03435 family)
MPARTLKTSILVALLALQTYGQAPSPTPKFEVASLKPALSPMQLREKGLPPKQPIKNPSRFEMYNVSMRVLLRQVYQLDEYQKLQAPDWIDKEFFSVAAKLPNGAKQEQAPEMLRALLAERCKLAAHWETAEGTGYILSVGKDGPKLKKTPADEGPNTNWPVPSSGNGRSVVGAGQTAHGWLVEYRVGDHLELVVQGFTITELLNNFLVKKELDAPIVDRTALTGLYDFRLPMAGLWFPKASNQTTEAADPAEADIFKSMEKLGLKLEKRKVPIKHLVVDRLERVPTGN